MRIVGVGCKNPMSCEFQRRRVRRKGASPYVMRRTAMSPKGLLHTSTAIFSFEGLMGPLGGTLDLSRDHYSSRGRSCMGSSTLEVHQTFLRGYRAGEVWVIYTSTKILEIAPSSPAHVPSRPRVDTYLQHDEIVTTMRHAGSWQVRHQITWNTSSRSCTTVLTNISYPIYDIYPSKHQPPSPSPPEPCFAPPFLAPLSPSRLLTLQ